MIDVLFITRLYRRGNKESDVYKDFGLKVDGEIATLDYLRAITLPSLPRKDTNQSSHEKVDLNTPVLTPIYMNEYLKKYGISMVEIPSL